MKLKQLATRYKKEQIAKSFDQLSEEDIDNEIATMKMQLEHIKEKQAYVAKQLRDYQSSKSVGDRWTDEEGDDLIRESENLRKLYLELDSRLRIAVSVRKLKTIKPAKK